MAAAKRSASEKPAGTPAWVAVVGAVVAVGGLLWGIVSFFITKPEPAAKPVVPTVQQNADASNGNAVNAAGHSTVSIGGPAPDGGTNGSGANGNASAEPSAPVNQKAKGGPGGAAVNAADAAKVSVQNH